MSSPEDPPLGADWSSFRAARDRFFAQLRPEAMDGPPPAICPDAPPIDWMGPDGLSRDDAGLPRGT